MMKRNSISYNMNNKGSAIITALVVSTVLMVLCLSLLLVASSLFNSTVSREADFPDREYIYSVAEEVEKELTGVSCTYTDTQGVVDFFNEENHQLWDYIRINLWQNFNESTGEQEIDEAARANGSIWPYYDENSELSIHKDIELCSRYFTLDTGVDDGNKIVVQFYWELPENWDGNINNKDNTILHAIYRMYGDNDEVVSKVERVYKLDCNTIEPIKDYSVTYYVVKGLTQEDLDAKVITAVKYYSEGEKVTFKPSRINDSSFSKYKLGSSWYYEKDGSISTDNIFSFEEEISGDLSLYNVCVMNTVPVIFLYNNPDNTEIFDSQTVTIGQTAIKPQNDPVVEGYVFVGWYKNPEGTEIWNFNDTISEETTIYAKWNKLHTVTFYLRNGLNEKFSITDNSNLFTDEIYTVKVEHGKTINEFSNPSASNTTNNNNNKTAKFFGWMVDSSSTDTLWQFSSAVTEDHKLYAKWEVTQDYFAYFWKNNYAVYLNDLIYMKSTHGKDHDLPISILQSSDYINAVSNDYFDCSDTWYIDSNCKTPFVFGSNDNKENVDLYASWTRKAYKVSYNINGHGSWSEETLGKTWEYSYDEKIQGPFAKKENLYEPTINTDSVVGYRLDGWTYKVTQKVDEKTESTVILPEVLGTKWNFNNPLDYSEYNDDTTRIEIELSANWVPEYIINYYDFSTATDDHSYTLVDSTAPFTQEEVKDLSINENILFEKDNYRFKGWSYTYSSEDIIESVNTIVCIDHADQNHIINLYAIWDKEYSVNFYDEKSNADEYNQHIIKSINGKTEEELNSLISVGTFFDNIPNITVTGYNNIGYSYLPDGTDSIFKANEINIIDLGYANNDTITIYVRREAIQYYLKFYDYNNNEYSKKLQFTIETLPQKNTIEGIFDGKTRTGYYFDTFTMYSGDDIVYSGSDKRAEFDLTKVDSNDNSISLKEKWNLYTYSIIYRNAQYDLGENETKVVEYNDVVFPLGKQETYTLQSNNPIRLPIPQRDGSDFLGWYMKNGNEWVKVKELFGSDEHVTGYELTYNPSNPGNITVYAVWQTKMYYVRFDTFGVNTPFEASFSRDYAINQKVYQPTSADLSSFKNGIEVEGWYKDSNLTNEWNFDTDTVTEPIILYAKMLVDVTFDAGDGHFEEESANIGNKKIIKVQYNTALSELPSNPVRDEYVFSNWTPKYSGTPILDVTEFVAEWNELANYTVKFENLPGSSVDDCFLPAPISNVAPSGYITKEQAKPNVDNPNISCEWYMDADCSKKYDYNKSLEQNFGDLLNKNENTAILYAKWNHEPFKVRFLVNNISALELDKYSGERIYASEIKVNTDDYYSQYGEFDGWYYGNTRYFPGNNSVIVKSACDFKAEFNGFKITYIYNTPEGGKYGIYDYEYILSDKTEYVFVKSGMPIGQNNLKTISVDHEFQGSFLEWLLQKIVNAFRNEVRNPLFIGWYRDPQFRVLASPDDLVFEDILLYARWVTNDDIVTTKEIDAKPDPQNLSDSTMLEFENYYKNNRKVFDYVFDNKTYSKKQALKYWCWKIKKLESYTNASVASKIASTTLISEKSLETNGIIVKTASAPNESDSQEYNQGVRDTQTEGVGTIGIDNNDIETKPETRYPIPDTYIVNNSITNQFGHTINPRELWIWKKVG